jgi:hypothetical protein
VGDQAGDGGAAGVVRAEDLAQEDPERNQRGEDPVQPAGDRRQRLLDDVFGQDVGERQVAVLQELAAEEVDLLAIRCSVGMAHLDRPLRAMEWLPCSIFASAALFAYVIPEFRLAEI